MYNQKKLQPSIFNKEQNNNNLAVEFIKQKIDGFSKYKINIITIYNYDKSLAVQKCQNNQVRVKKIDDIHNRSIGKIVPKMESYFIIKILNKNIHILTFTITRLSFFLSPGILWLDRLCECIFI